VVGGMFRVNSPAVEEASFLEERERREGEAFMTRMLREPSKGRREKWGGEHSLTRRPDGAPTSGGAKELCEEDA